MIIYDPERYKEKLSMNTLLLNTQTIYFSQFQKLKRLSRLIACIAASLFFSTLSSAQTRYYVNQTVAASGDGKSWGAAFKNLSEAITVASSSVADEIWVAKGTYNPNTNLYGTRFDPPSFSYSMAYFIKKPVKIYGGFIGTETALTQRNWETNETILSGNINDAADSTDNIYHVLLIMGTEASPLENVIVDGFTIRDGYANVITSLTVDGNVVYAYNGGGIYNIYASPQLKNLKVIKNVGFVGGGIHNKNSSPVIDNCQILQNYSGSSGGGIYNLNGSPLIRNTLIEGNIVNNIGGGGIDNASSDVTIINSSIRNNKASKGGGVSSSGGHVTMENVLIENNNATTDGGGLYNFTKTYLFMKHVTISGNDAKFGGGMRTFRAILQIDSSRISNNIAQQYGGGIYSDGDSLQISYSNIDSNKATFYQGGGMFVESAVLHLTGGSVNGNSAKTDAGGIYFRKNTHGTINQTEFSKNISLRQGGGIYLLENLDPLKQFHFTKMVLSGNEAVSGGGMYLTSTSPVLEDITFTGNTTKYEGAGLTVSNGSYPDVSNCRFEKNKGSSGAGMFSADGANATMRNVSFYENEAVGYSGDPTGYGGAIYCGGTGDFNAITIRGNKATHGGGAYVAGAVNLTNALITGNYATGRGGGVFIDNAAPVLTNTTFAGNNALLGGGGIYADRSSSSKIRNSVVYGNNTGLAGYMVVTYSLVEGATDATNGNIPGSSDPQFVGSKPFANAPITTGNYFLNPTSPLIDKGDNSLFQVGSVPDLSGITTDLLGNTRFFNTVADMGGYEYQPGIILPVTLVSFDALLQNNAVQLSWKTMDEVNVSHFEIERSIDAISFSKIGTQKANGSGLYLFNNRNLPQGNIYYRLKMIDRDGQFEYSYVKLAKVLNISESEMITYPIPSTNVIYITNKNKSLIKGFFSVYSATGKKVMQTYSNPLNIQSLVPGMYYIKVVDATGKLIGSKTFIRQ